MRYLRSPHFTIHVMALWWLLWLAVALSPFNIFLAPSWEVGAQYAAFIALFLVGHAVVVLLQQPGLPPAKVHARPAPFNLRYTLYAANTLCLTILAVSLYRSGALTDGFVGYFLKLRAEEVTGDSLTGLRLLDVATKAIVWPMAYTVTIVVLAIRTGGYRGTLAVSVLNILLFSYLWQVNYSLIYLFWFFFLYVLVGVSRGLPIDRKVLLFVASLVAVLVAVAGNRFGGDVLGGVQRYVFGYHTAGFAFYDHHFHSPSSLLHEHSFGRSSLGLLEQLFEIVSRRVDLGFVAASSDNANFNNNSVDIGARESIEGNAFGTFLFGFYRDFHLVGVAVGGLLFGGLSTYTLMKGPGHWPSASTFYVFGTAWMVGMMVNPVEQAHFWFALLMIGALSIVNRGFKL